MKPAHSKNIFRWLLIAVFGGVGVWFSWESLFTLHGDFVCASDWLEAVGTLLVTALFILPICGFPLVVAYCTYKRQYQRLCMLAGGVAALVVFFTIIALPEKLGIYAPKSSNPLMQTEAAMWRALGLEVLEVVLVLGCFIYSFKAADWVYRKVSKILWARVSKRMADPSSFAAA